MKHTYESQLLVETETKLNAMKYHLDSYFPSYPPRPLLMEYYDLVARVDKLKNELSLVEAR